MVRSSVVHTIAYLIVAALASTAQTQEAPTFKMANVHRVPGRVTPTRGMRGDIVRDGRYEIYNATMVDLVRTAYDLEADDVTGGPSWVELDRFNVIASVPPGTSRAMQRQMLRSLLADLVVRPDSRVAATWVLTTSTRAARLRPAERNGNASCQTQVDPPQRIAMCRGMTMAALARELRQMAGDYIETAVIDATPLDGAFDFELRWTTRAALATAGTDATPLQDAVTNQLGLRLTRQERSHAGLHLISVERTPTPNAAGVEACRRMAADQLLPEPEPRGSGFIQEFVVLLEAVS